MGKPFYIFVCCIFSFSAFVQSQSFKDTIFTKDNDTILCQITLVNEHNIFYNYKKKKWSRAADISQEQVLTNKSDNPKLLELINRPRFLKCDTCENWLAFKSGDTAYYRITPLYLNHKKVTFQFDV